MYDLCASLVNIKRLPDKVRDKEIWTLVEGWVDFLKADRGVESFADILIIGDDRAIKRGDRAYLKMLSVVSQCFANAGGEVRVGYSNIMDYDHKSGHTATTISDISKLNLVHYAQKGVEAIPVDTRVYYISKLIKEADLIINMPSVKLPGDKISGAMKNLLNIIPGLNQNLDFLSCVKSGYLCELIVDIGAIVQPDFNIMFLSSQKDKEMSYLMVSEDMVALDRVLSRYLDVKDNCMSHIKLATDAGLGMGWPEGIQIGGDKFEVYGREMVSEKLVSAISMMWERLRKRSSRIPLKYKPAFQAESCAGCGVCAKLCPTKALRYDSERGEPVFRSEFCVGCLSCAVNCCSEAIKYSLEDYY